jgi:hypothetical protein
MPLLRCVKNRIKKIKKEMLNKTRGSLKTTNYSESSLVAQLYTEQFGMQSYLITGARKPKAKSRPISFNPYIYWKLSLHIKIMVHYSGSPKLVKSLSCKKFLMILSKARSLFF